tara:strand:+ start:4798 stop:6528 length:1731 start_codon:yes stop_codon:yes gene_type:complete
MIKFNVVRWKNFLSTGDTFTQIQIDKSPSTLIVGDNGSGKSTLLDAVSFALFGKPHRNINKIQMVNSINNKGCVVEVEFEIGSHSFKIVRAIKPNKFEIWQNGNMINQASASRDYQKYLEQNILKLNHKSFHQIVVLGSSSFIPFMQLQTYHRRAVIEDLLDIQIFTKMNMILKERNSVLRDELIDANYNLDLTKEKITVQKKYIKDITEMNEEQIDGKQLEIDEARTEIEVLNEHIKDSNDYVVEHQDKNNNALKELHDKKQSLSQYKFRFEQQIGDVVKDAKFYEENAECPTCSQEINDDLRNTKMDAAKAKAKELQTAIGKAASEAQAVNSLIDELNSIQEEITTKQKDIHSNTITIERLQKSITTLQNDIEGLIGKDGDLGKANKELSDLQIARDSWAENKLTLIEEQTYNTAAGEMLKDTGIKTKIIKEYLPVMNNLVNKYLSVLDFFVSFELDENFNESIKSRYRDTFNYASFSEGEKQRIDLALLFTWRQIARMKNSASTNLLILDETFDSSLDHDGIDSLMKILGSLEEGSNVFVISHKGDLLDGKFRSKIEFVKERNFSKIYESKIN